MQTKLEKLLRFHRQNVFNEHNGDNHHRAILRLKKTATFREMCGRNDAHSRYLHGERLARMGY